MAADTTVDHAAGDSPPSAYAPLRRAVFRGLWLASLAANVGTWVQNVGAAWLMTGLSPSPLLVALVQAATTLPVFLVGLPAGALADVVDRRRLLLVAQGWMLAAAGLLAALTAAGLVTPAVLLALTFAIGLGFALNAPAWQAVIPELVPREEVQAAVGLNGISVNASRAVGPAVGGLLVAAAGPEAAFLLYAVSFVAVLVVLYRWDRPAERSTLPAERLVGAMRAGLRYVRHAPAVRAVLVRTAAFVTGASGLWALLPAATRADPGRGPGAYGVLLGCLGVGAVAGTFALPAARRAWGTGRVVAAGTLAFAVGTGVVAIVPVYGGWCAALIPAGAGWLAVLTSLSGSIQSLVPGWVRARVIAVYLLVFYGGLAGGSVAWGIAADRVGTESALALAAAWTAAGLFAALRYRLPEGPPPDVEPSRHWPEAPAVPDPDAAGGPVLVLVEYRVRPTDAEAFLAAAAGLRATRLRNGAVRWDLFADTEDAGRYVESFLVESWAEHLRQHDRVTGADRAAEAAVRAFHAGDDAPRVTHLIAATGRPRKGAAGERTTTGAGVFIPPRVS
ncbi:MAG: transporter [Gemmataceae bacterium]|nr:transporter [Gemmataceae bacterium]